MICESYIPRIRATTVAVAGGITTITLPATPVVSVGDVFDILLATPIPDGTDGTQISITNGTITGNLMNGNGNYLRLYPVTSRTVLRVQYLADPAHFQIINVASRKQRKICN
ncbi:MAG: hypothetical protein J6S85_19695 [Methanobrevibacter sp.]|nr:hypothetical protein [Methanobrevibacter sp.]